MRHNVLVHDSGHVTFFRTCPLCREETAITESEEKYRVWRSGAPIQDVWPELDVDVRELYISGTHPECWDELFGEVDDEQ